MKLKHYTAKAIICLTLLFVISSCKKGEDDPAFTLATRRARVAGDWRLKEGTLTVTALDASSNYTQLTQKFSDSDVSFELGGKQGALMNSSLRVSCTKQGKITISQIMGSDSFNATGTWDFLGSDGENKNKERITMELTSINGTSYYDNFFNKSQTRFTYRIKELRSKQMILVAEGELLHVDKNGVPFTISSEYVFVQ